jgi:hypothetical protein
VIGVETNRATSPVTQSVAAILIVGTNLLPLSAYDITHNRSLPSYERLVQDPIATATSRTVQSTQDEPRDATRILVNPGTRWNRYVIGRLAALRAGSDNHSDLMAPTPWIVDRAWEVAKRYFPPATPPPSVVPSEDGDIVFIWHKAGWELQIEVGSEGAAVWAYERHSGIMWSGSLEERQQELRNLLGLLARR